MSASSPASALPTISAGRKRKDRFMRGTLLVGTGIALVPLVLVVYYLIYKGVSSWTGSGFFTTDPNGNFFGNPGGIRSAIVGTLEIVALASLIAIPVGIAVALYLTEYGKQHWFANTVRYFVDVMTGVPSVVFGLFIYIVLVISHAGGSGFARPSLRRRLRSSSPRATASRPGCRDTRRRSAGRGARPGLVGPTPRGRR
jgi:phosphate transport system permease protein